MWPFKKERRGDRFKGQHELGRELAAVRTERIKAEMALERAQARILKDRARNVGRSDVQTPGSRVRESIEEIKALRDAAQELGLVSEGDGGNDGSDLKDIIELAKLLNANKASRAAVQDDQDQDQETTPHKPQGKGQKTDEIDEIISRIPPKMQNMVKKGLIPESQVVAYARKQGEDLGKKVYKRLRAKK